MTESINVAIQAVLYEHLKGSTSPVKDVPRRAPFVIGENVYQPVEGTLYLDVHPMLRAEPEHFGIDLDNADILKGIFQVDVVAPLGPGEAPGLRIADLIAARYAPKSTSLTANGRWLRIVRPPSIATAVKDAPWVRFPVSIRYQLITT